MEDFILKIIGTICATIITLAIIISRKDDIDIAAIIIAAILEILSLLIIYFPKDILIEIFEKII